MDESVARIVARGLLDLQSLTATCHGENSLYPRLAARLGRLGDPSGFGSLAAAVVHGPRPPRSTPPVGPVDVLREALFSLPITPAGWTHPSRPAITRLMTDAGKHHTSAIYHIAPALLTRIIACCRTCERYALRDVDGRTVDPVEAPSHHRPLLRSRPRCDHGRPDCTSNQERVAEDRGREAPDRPTCSPVTLSP